MLHISELCSEVRLTGLQLLGSRRFQFLSSGLINASLQSCGTPSVLSDSLIFNALEIISFIAETT